MLDLYLAVADASMPYSRALAKQFLDKSFEVVAANDPSVFPQTSDGSLSDYFTYTKADISRLYAEVGEYHLAMIANERIEGFSESKVMAYLNILDSELGDREGFDAKILNALRAGMQLPTFRKY